MNAVSTLGVSYCVFDKQKKIQDMHGNVLYLFDYWADPVVHLILLKGSMPRLLFSHPPSEAVCLVGIARKS